jgi:hypothetical protein
MSLPLQLCLPMFSPKPQLIGVRSVRHIYVARHIASLSKETSAILEVYRKGFEHHSVMSIGEDSAHKKPAVEASFLGRVLLHCSSGVQYPLFSGCVAEVKAFRSLNRTLFFCFQVANLAERSRP